MGFGSVAAMVFFFLFFVLFTGYWVSISQSQFEPAISQSDEQLTLVTNELFSQIQFLNATYDANNTVTELYLQNTGRTKLVLDDTNVFRNGVRLASSAFTLEILAETNVGNELLWDPAEIAQITIPGEITTSHTKFRVVATHGSFAETLLVVDLSALGNNPPEFLFDLFDVSRSAPYPTEHTLYTIDDLEAFTYDADGDELTFSLVGQTNSVDLPCVLNTIGVVCSPVEGVTFAQTTLTVRVSDPFGAFDESSFVFTLDAT